MNEFSSDVRNPTNWNRDERNLYIRVFAQFLFAAGENSAERAGVLFDCPNLLCNEKMLNPRLTRTPRPKGPLTVTFDNNLHDVVPDVKTGPEYGDVVIWGQDEFVTIEAKCNSDWKFEKDVENCLSSAKRVAASTGKTHLAHILLVADKKWQRVRSSSATHHPRSNFKKLTRWGSRNNAPFCVLTWEQIAEKARGRPGESATNFSIWLEMQVQICMRESAAMPPAP